MGPNVVLVVCDTLRKDVLGVYGGEANTPFLNSFAREAMVYENAIAPSPWTYPSHVSLFTGQYVSEHGVHETEKIKLLGLTRYHNQLKTERLAEYLSGKGYETFGISNNIMVSPFTSFDRGFDSFISLDPAPKTGVEEIFKEARKLGASPAQIAKELLKRGRFKDLLRYAGAWQRINKLNKAMDYPLEKGSRLTNDIVANCKLDPSFFYFINFVEMHEPYTGYKPKETWDNFTGVKPIAGRKADFLKAQYVKEAEYLDRALEALVKTLKRRGFYDDTMIIITSDHGQAFNEHGYMYHNTYLYDEIIRIPLIIKYPHGKKFPKKAGYQSLVNVSRQIHETMEGGNDSAITKEAVFSEAYGDVTVLPGGYNDRKSYVRNKYEKVRKAVYKDGFKLTVNGTDGVIEEFLKGDKEADLKVHRSAAERLIEELDIFKGSEKFKLPSL